MKFLVIASDGDLREQVCEHIEHLGGSLLGKLDTVFEIREILASEHIDVLFITEMYVKYLSPSFMQSLRKAPEVVLMSDQGVEEASVASLGLFIWRGPYTYEQFLAIYGQVLQKIALKVSKKAGSAEHRAMSAAHFSMKSSLG